MCCSSSSKVANQIVKNIQTFRKQQPSMETVNATLPQSGHTEIARTAEQPQRNNDTTQRAHFKASEQCCAKISKSASVSCVYFFLKTLAFQTHLLGFEVRFLCGVARCVWKQSRCALGTNPTFFSKVAFIVSIEGLPS